MPKKLPRRNERLEAYEAEIAEANALRADAGLAPLPKLRVSFSGGRTSAVMTKRLWDERRHTHHLVITFANTGQEHHETLEFVHRCEEHWGWPLVWLEAQINPLNGKGVRHRIVDYHSACRDGSIFAAAVKKYGIFNATKKSCTSRLKENVMDSYTRSIGWNFGKKLDHSTAIGIRADEIDRQSQSGMANHGIVYPMIEWGMTKRDVAIEMKKWPFDLQIPGDHYGNCTWCWKKSRRKLMTLALESPEVFDVPAMLEEKYGHLDAQAGRKCCDENGRAWFFRGHDGAKDIIEQAKSTDFVPYSDDPYHHAYDFDPDLDVGGSCGDSCEAWTDQED